MIQNQRMFKQKEIEVSFGLPRITETVQQLCLLRCKILILKKDLSAEKRKRKMSLS